MMRDFMLPGRSPVYARHGMAATSHPLASIAALDILRAGGNALDAAVAACAVQGVVEPQSTGIGGDCFCLFAPQGSDRIVAYNGSGRAPRAATAGRLRELGVNAIERQSPHAVTVPGAVDAWDRLLRDHGRLSLGEVLRPAIGHAREGYPITPRVAFDMAAQRELLAADPEAGRVFLVDGRTPQVGEVHRQPELADALETVAAEGRDGFYRGPLADAMVSYLQAKGGLHTAADFAAAGGEYVTPISVDYRGYRVWQCPPNGQGVIALLLLNMLAGDGADDPDPLSARRLHLEIEAGRLAYRERALWVADPAQAAVPVDTLLAPDYAAQLAAGIDPQRAAAELPPSPLSAVRHRDTVYISVVDAERNACSFINSLFHSFGSVQMPPGSGVMLHNRGQGFVLDAAHPNAIAPGKRPLHTIIPAMLTRDGRAVMPFGVMGGHYQAFGQMQFLTRLLDYGRDIQQAQDLPRLFPEPGAAVQVESGLPATVAERLAAMGHRLVAAEKPLGGSQAVWIDRRRGVLVGGSDPRKDGCAIGY